MVLDEAEGEWEVADTWQWGFSESAPGTCLCSWLSQGGAVMGRPGPRGKELAAFSGAVSLGQGRSQLKEGR